MLTLDAFKNRIITPEIRESLFELNPNRKEYTEYIDPKYKETKYLLCDDVLMNPYDVRDFLINASYCTGTNDLIPTKVGAPGIQQPICNEWCKEYVQYLNGLVQKFKITSKTVTWYDFSCYCNLFWKGMKSINSNYYPHVDPSDMAFNLFLSDDLDEREGTAFFRINVQGEEFNDIRLYEKIAQLHPRVITQRMDQGRVATGEVDDWQYFQGDECYTQLGVIPARFNCISAYRGSIFHTACYDPAWYPEGHLRYSLVSMLSISNPVGKLAAQGFMAKKPSEEE